MRKKPWKKPKKPKCHLVENSLLCPGTLSRTKQLKSKCKHCYYCSYSKNYLQILREFKKYNNK